MQFTKLIPVAVLAFAVACSDSDTATSPTSVPGPLFAVDAGSYPGTLNTANTPSGGHLQSGSIGCTVSGANFSITCSSFQVSGIGNRNATVSLNAQYTAIVDCNNPGSNKNNPIESHETSFSPSSTVQAFPTKNGRVTIPSRTVSFSGAPIGCPNENWEPVIRSGSVELVSFSYTVTFAGFSSPAVSISEP